MTEPQRPPFWVSGLLVVAGAAISAVAVWSIASWHADTPRAALWVVVERIQQDAAWAFAFAGASLILFGLRAATIARLFAVIPMLLGAQRVVARFAGSSTSIDRVLTFPRMPDAAGGADEMGIVTALVLVGLGCALLVLPTAERRSSRLVFLVSVASVVLALALLLFAGASTGGPTAAQWLMLTGGDRTNAALAMLASGAIIAYALLGTSDERRAIGRWAPGIVGFAVFVCALVLWRALALHEANLTMRASDLVASDIGRQMELDIDRRVRVLARLAKRARIYATSPQEWQEDAATVRSERNEFESIAWIDDALIVRWADPPDANEVPGADLGADPVRGPAIAAAVRSRRTVLTAFFEGADHNRRLAIYVPFFDEGVLRGVVGATIMGDTWFHALLQGRFPQYEVALGDRGGLVSTVSGDGPAAAAQWAVERMLAIADAPWDVRVTPTVAHLRESDSILPEAALALGSLLGGLLALCTFLFQTASHRAGALSAVNARLVADIAARERAERALSASENRMRLIVDSLKELAVFMLDAEGNIASWNAGAAQLTGYRGPEAIGRHYTLLYPPGSDAAARPDLERAARDGSLQFEGWHQRRDGSRFRGEDTIAAIQGDGGELRGYAFIARDATQPIELREEIERSRDYYLTLFSSLPNLIWRSDAAGGCDYVNDTWIEYTGCARDAPHGAGWLESLHSDDRARWSETFQRALTLRQPFEIEFRLRRADGNWGSMIFSARPYRDMQGRFAGFLGSCFDHTARLAAETALKESEARYEGITANVPGMVFQLVRSAGNEIGFTYVSPGCEPLTGVGEAVLRRDAEAFFGLIPPTSRPQLDATLEASARQLKTWTWSGPLRAAHDSTEKWVTLRARPRRQDGDGDTLLWDGLLLDDTQNRLAQLESERSREELRELSRHLQSVREEEKARIARELHDELGSTLTALKMDLDWLGSRLASEGGTAVEKYVAMRSLVDAAVAATRRIVTDLRPSVLDDLGLAAALHWQAGEYRKHGGLRIDVVTPEPDVVIDRERSLTLFRIFQEALTNVMRHAQATTVSVELGESGERYVLQVSDDGVGIPDDALGKASSHGIRGMRERARQLGGDAIVSRAPGGGTTVVVTIPKPAASTPRALGDG